MDAMTKEGLVIEVVDSTRDFMRGSWLDLADDGNRGSFQVKIV